MRKSKIKSVTFCNYCESEIIGLDLDKNKSKAICLQNLKKHQETCPEKNKHELNNK
jgi:hypothetical protein